MGFRAQTDLGRSETGSALHHLVTAFSVKKGLMVLTGIKLCYPDAKPRAMQHAHRRQKKRKVSRH